MGVIKLLKRQCKRCVFEYEFEPFANLITFCPSCNKYDYLSCEYGFGPVVPCRIYHGSKVIGLVSYNDVSERVYRLDSDELNIHKVLNNTYLQALEEAIDIVADKL